MTIVKDWISRLGRNWKWIAAQFGLMLVLVLVFVAWTRIPERNGFQVFATLVVPLGLLADLLWLWAKTVRAFADDDGKRVRFFWGSLSLLVWIAVWALCWHILDWCDERTYEWASYLNAKASAGWRARTFTFPHIVHILATAEWILRWIVVPAKLASCAAATALWGWRLPWRRLLRLLWNWRWWLAVVVAALAGVRLPEFLFSGQPHGTASAQEWSVGLKTAASYVLAIGAWVLLLAWWAALFCAGSKPPAEEKLVAVPAGGGPPEREQGAEAVPEG